MNKQNTPRTASRSLRIVSSVLAGMLLMICLMIDLKAQGSTDGTTPLGLSPGSPTGSYTLSDFDVVNLYNGSLNFRLPIYQIAGRGGAAYAITLQVQKKWTVYRHFEPGVDYFYYADGNWWSENGVGWILDAGRVDIRTGYREQPTGFPVEGLTRVTFTAPDGTEYEFRDQLTNGQPQAPVSGGFNRGTIFVTADGTTATFISDWDIHDTAYGLEPAFPDGYIKLKDGKQFRVDDGTITWMRDRNGNKVTFGYDPFRRITSITDSLNRLVTISYPGGTTGFTQISYKGYGGAPRTMKIGQTNLASALRSDYSMLTGSQMFPELNGVWSIDSLVINYIELPDQRSYQLRYNPYAELARVVLPTGGAIEYDYAAGLTDGAVSGVFSHNFPPTEKYIYRRVIERRVYPDGGSSSAYESKMTYSRPETTTTNLGYVIAEQRNASGTLLTKSQHYFHGSPRASFLLRPTQYPAWKDGREYKTEMFHTNGSTILKRIENTFAQRALVSWWGGTSDTAPPNDPRTTETVTTIEPASSNLVSKQTFGYDDSVPFSNPNNVKEYNFGTGSAGTLARETRTTFVTSSSYTDNAVHLRGLPSQVSIHDGSGSERARISYEYDNYTTNTNHAALTNRANISGLDSTFGTSYTTRGNATATTRYFFENGSVTGSISTYAQYDIAGNMLKGIDGRGYITTYIYTDCFGTPNGEAQTSIDPTELGSVTKTFAYVTEVRNALDQRTYAQFDYYLGRPVDARDVNGIVASGYYEDLLDRPTQIKRAVGTADESHTAFDYDDDADRTITTTSDLNMNNDGLLISKLLYDQMGRTIETRQYEGGANYISVKTEYDVLGRAYKTSNPFRPWQSESAIWTTQGFDALGRVISVTTPDNAVATTSYSGNSVTATDQAGKRRKSITDAVGRLIEVYEDPAVPGGPAELNYQTIYDYDVLDNLTTVTQGTQTRTFVYDSLKRLRSATNPESGTVSYDYDNNSNLTQKTDARGVVTTNVYDALNRVTTILYRINGQPDPNTGDIEYLYDNATNGKGRLWLTYRWGAKPSHTAVGLYDALGRVTQLWNLFGDGQGGWSPGYGITRTYNLAGGITSQTYPSGHSVTYNYDSAGRLADKDAENLAFTGNLGGVPRTYSRGISYAAAGQLKQEQFGTTTPVYNKLFYNSRQQLAEILTSTTGGDSSWNRGKIINSYSLQCSGAMCNATDNNGNLRQQAVYIPGNDQVSSWTNWYQQYDYDELNRLKRVHEYTGNTSLDWQQEFNYDRWGNRTVHQTNTWGTNIPKPNFGIDPANNNRLTAPAGYSISYDNAGNLTSDTYAGLNSGVYDAENRIAAAQNSYGGWSYYTYNADGQRVRRKINNQETWQIYGIDGELLAEYPANGAVASPRKEYGYRNGQLLITAESSASGAQNVTWTNAVGVTVNNNSLTRGSVPVGWTAGASSAEAITSGDGYVEFSAAETNTNRMCGLSNGDANQDYSDIDFALYLYSDGTFYVFESGVNKGNFGSYASGDRFQVSVEGGVVKYRRNGTVVFSSTVTPTYPLLVDTALSIPNATINNVTFLANVVENVQWTTAVNVTVTGNSLTKPINGNVAWDAGAVSTQAIASGDGYMEVTASERNTNRMAGLSNGDSNQSYADIDFAIYLYSDGNAYVFEGGVNRGSVGSYAVNDIFRVAVESGVVKYRKNGALLYTSTVTPTYPLLVDTAISIPGGTLNNVRLSGTLVGGTSGKINWLVTDHLGTPRMVIDQTGSLANVKRHDYLPFGEELISQQGLRSATLGYSGGDGVRQQFTSYERDYETGLDFAGARFYSSGQGRFTSVDPLMTSAKSENPQTFNRYSYVLNSPLTTIDPTGMFGISPGGSQLGGIGSLGSFSLNGQTGEDPEQPQQPQQPNPAQATPATQATEPQTPTSVTAEVPLPDTLVNIPFRGGYINGVGSIIRFTIRDQNGNPIQNVTVLESVIPRTTIQNPDFVTFPDGVVTDIVGRGTQSPQPLTRQQAGNVIVPILATPTPPVVQDHIMIMVAPNGRSAIATHQRSYTNLDAQGNHRPFVNPQTGRSISNFDITVSRVTVVKMPVVMCPRF